ncbi:MAG TPA: hypothetical protein VI141_03580, partial [Acidimicrobiia bacterium]
MFLAACSSFLGETPVETNPGSEGATATTPAGGCIRFTGDHSANIDSGSVASDALYLSGELFLCADDVVIVGESDLNEIAAAAQLAASVSGPLLFPEARLAAELGRLKPQRVHVVGALELNIPGSAELVEHDVASAIDLARDELGVSSEIDLPAAPDASTVVESVLALDDADRVAVPRIPEPTSSTTPAAAPVVDVPTVVRGLAVPSDAASLWMVDAASPATVLLAAALGKSINASVLAVDGTDILGYPEVGTTVAGHPSETIRYI